MRVCHRGHVVQSARGQSHLFHSVRCLGRKLFLRKEGTFPSRLDVSSGSSEVTRSRLFRGLICMSAVLSLRPRAL